MLQQIVLLEPDSGLVNRVVTRYFDPDDEDDREWADAVIDDLYETGLEEECVGVLDQDMALVPPLRLWEPAAA